MTFDVAVAARALLEANWREGDYRGRHYAFSVPSPRSYPWQWYWDSCFHAIVRRRFDPAGARAELETLLSAADPDGFIGHTVLWGHPLDAQRAIRYNIASRAGSDDAHDPAAAAGVGVGVGGGRPGA